MTRFPLKPATSRGFRQTLVLPPKPAAPASAECPAVEPEVITVGWSGGFEFADEDKLNNIWPADESLGTADSVTVPLSGESVVRFATVVGTASREITWRVDFAASNSDTQYPDIGAHFNTLCFSFSPTNESPPTVNFRQGVYTITAYVDGVAVSPVLTLTVSGP